MATEVPAVAVGDTLSDAWADIVQTAMIEVRTSARKMGPAACTINLSGWANYGGLYADAQVVRIGDFVILEGLVRNNSGAAAALPISSFATIPSGYRPRPVGSGAPLGGAVMTSTYGSFANGTARLDVSASGTLSIGTSTGAVTLPNGGFLTLQGMWHAEPLADELSGILKTDVGGDLHQDWFNSIFWVVTALEGNVDVSGPAAIAPVSTWEAYPSGWTTPQVYRMGPLVIANGLMRLKTGSATPTVPVSIGTIPSGYRPRPTGASAPLGGRVITVQRCNSSALTPAEGVARVDFTDTGDVVVQALVGGTVLQPAGSSWVNVAAMWIGE